MITLEWKIDIVDKLVRKNSDATIKDYLDVMRDIMHVEETITKYSLKPRNNYGNR